MHTLDRTSAPRTTRFLLPPVPSGEEEEEEVGLALRELGDG